MGNAGFVHGGHQRARAALEPRVRTEVMREYAQRLSQATLWRYWRLMWEIDREVERRIHQKAPPGALY